MQQSCFGATKWVCFFINSFSGFLPGNFLKAMENGLPQVKSVSVSWPITKLGLFLLTLSWILFLFSNCKICDTFSLTKHEASVVVPYFPSSSKRKHAMSWLWSKSADEMFSNDQELGLHVYGQTVPYHCH